MQVSNHSSSFVITVCDIDHLTIPAHSKVSSDHIERLFFNGSNILITCDDKYKLMVGGGKATCNNGTWDESDIGVCSKSQKTEMNRGIY